nr:MAG TPA: hypothetical protein [Caudoviricetes sp.]
MPGHGRGCLRVHAPGRAQGKPKACRPSPRPKKFRGRGRKTARPLV